MRNLFFIIMTLTFTFLGAENWYSYTDNVMGGKSELVAKVNEDNSITLKGDVTTENNGGFVRLATRPDGLSENIKGIRFQAKGNNETYDLHVSLKGIKMPPWSFKSKSFMSLTNGKIFKLNSKILKTMDTQLEGLNLQILMR